MFFKYVFVAYDFNKFQCPNLMPRFLCLHDMVHLHIMVFMFFFFICIYIFPCSIPFICFRACVFNFTYIHFCVICLFDLYYYVYVLMFMLSFVSSHFQIGNFNVGGIIFKG
jgi:hypothetical protein